MEIRHKQIQAKNDELVREHSNHLEFDYPDIKLGYEGGKEFFSSNSLEKTLTIMNRNMHLLYKKYPNSF